MLTYSSVANATRHPKSDAPVAGNRRSLRLGDVKSNMLEVGPAHAVHRRDAVLDGIRVEIIQAVTDEEISFRFRGDSHVLLVYQEGVRDAGATELGDLASSELQTLRRKLTFVPAGLDYQEWQQPRIRTRVICFYFDPGRMPVYADTSAAAASLQAKLFFENTPLWDTAVRLATAIEQESEGRYCETLGVLVAYELLRTFIHVQDRETPARGGLAAWQQRMVTRYIEDHLAERVPLAVLAKLVRLSSFHFSHAFKQTFRVPPHRYHMMRRIERAKALLADSQVSVTAAALALGFSDTSSFSAAFRGSTGTTPSSYRRTST